MGKNLLSSVLLISVSALFACSKEEPTPPPKNFVQSVSFQTLDKKVSVAPDKTSSRSIQVQAVLDKKSILNQDYFYVSNLQYSSIYDKKNDLYTQSSASALVPVHFRIVGKELHLIADNKIQYPSDVNHPELLITRYKIIEETASTLTVSEGNSASYLASEMQTNASSAGAAEDLWVRSFEFAPEGSYLLQETSVLMPSGDIGEFLESVFPRENMKPSSAFKIFQMNPEETSGTTDPIMGRFRLLQSDRIFAGETKLSYAVHFDLPNDKSTIDWYVTANIPDEDLEAIGLSVEGWNRYFKNFKGLHRAVMNFKGRLPAGIHLGDPRYNVINWDSRLVAGAAYESQSFDPSSGKQANSIIYMPAAWIKIGMSYWSSGEFSEAQNPPSVGHTKGLQGRPVCYRDMHDAAAYLASGKLKVGSEESLKKFGVELLKQTLFHELGHSLGLDHNFKGSLSYKPADAKPNFSNSIMDYNDFEIERAAFEDLHSALGPQLEYDRQALSFLYDNGLDISNSDPILPVCNDKEADNEVGGIDPLCTRYDIESDPTHSIIGALNRINQSSLAHDVSLSEALLQVPVIILSAEALSNIKLKADFDQIVQKLSSAFDGVLNYYLSSGRSSLGYATRANLKSLFKFNEKVSLLDLDPRLMRENVFNGVTQILKLKSLPDNVAVSLSKARDQALELLKTSNYLSGITTSESGQIILDKQKLMSSHIANFSKDEKLGLPTLHTKILSAMVRHPGVSFFFGKYDKTQVDYEMQIIALLSEVASLKENTASVRMAAVKSLASFTGRKLGDDAISKVGTGILAERDAAEDSDARDLTESLMKAISAGPSSPSAASTLR